MSQSEVDDLRIDFTAYITERGAPKAEDPGCICSTAKHPAIATENVPTISLAGVEHTHMISDCLNRRLAAY